MSAETYTIVFRGEIVDGFEMAAVQAQLAKLLKLDAKKVSALFSGKRIVLKKTTDKAEAARYGKALMKVGADVKIRVIKADPPAAAPGLDLSGYSMAENDGSLLVEPTEEVKVDIDLSAYSVAENDGSDLFQAPAHEVPEIAVPDFGLDEPGAVLETLQEEKELLNPNTTGMTLAMAGSDLLEEDEKPPAPPAAAPDTSGINLVPNFD